MDPSTSITTGYQWELLEDCKGLLDQSRRPRSMLCFEQLARNLQRIAVSKLYFLIFSTEFLD